MAGMNCRDGWQMRKAPEDTVVGGDVSGYLSRDFLTGPSHVRVEMPFTMRDLYFATAVLFGVTPAIAAAPDVTPALLHDLAPSGHLRAAINFGNAVLAQKGPEGPRGISVALAQDLARELGVPVDFVLFPEAGQVTAAAAGGAWDVGFLAIDPVRATGIAFTPPYVVIEGVYAVPVASALREIGEIDRDGVRIGVPKGSAYDLFLTRTLKRARLVRAATPPEVFGLFEGHEIDVVAGVKQALSAYVQTHPDLREIPGRFMEIDQAMCMPKGHEAGLAFLTRFIEARKASGFVAKALAASGRADVTIAPAAAP